MGKRCICYTDPSRINAVRGISRYEFPVRWKPGIIFADSVCQSKKRFPSPIAIASLSTIPTAIESKSSNGSSRTIPAKAELPGWISLRPLPISVGLLSIGNHNSVSVFEAAFLTWFECQVRDQFVAFLIANIPSCSNVRLGAASGWTSSPGATVTDHHLNRFLAVVADGEFAFHSAFAIRPPTNPDKVSAALILADDFVFIGPRPRDHQR